MLSILKKDKKAIIVLVLFFVLTSWWVTLEIGHINNPDSLNLFSGLYGIVALVGGIWGLLISKKWGGFKAVIGRAIIMFSIGLLAQEFGQLVYAYYAIVSKIEVPYPSLGDVGYFGSVPLYIYGTILLAKASGVSISLKSMKNKIQAIVIPVGLLATSYFVFLRAYEFDWSHPLTVLLDFGYPFGQAIYISVAILAYLLSRKLLGGIMRTKILLILFALLAQYVADFNFLYQNSRNTWSTAGYGDFLYLIAYFLMTLSIINFGITLLSHLSKFQSSPEAVDPIGPAVNAPMPPQQSLPPDNASLPPTTDQVQPPFVSTETPAQQPVSTQAIENNPEDTDTGNGNG